MTYGELIESLGSMVCRIEEAGMQIEEILIDNRYKHYVDGVYDHDKITMFMGYPCKFTELPSDVTNYLVCLKPIVLDEVKE